MFLPVLLWPLPIVIFNNPMLPDMLLPTWIQCIALMLLVSVSMDSMLYGVASFKQAIDAMLWVALFSMVTISTLQSQNDAWPLAMLFLIHSLRSGLPLLRKTESSNINWLWLAWSRDVAAAFTIYFWILLNQ
ncbi:MAG: hypothetical protein R8M46_07175 [Ghiorsea sp.]